VQQLGLHATPYVDEIFLTSRLGGQGKKNYLRRELHRVRNPKRILVVGDRPNSEILAARELGLWTVRRQGGEFATHEPQQRLERAHHTIKRLSQLFSLPFRFAGNQPTASGSPR